MLKDGTSDQAVALQQQGLRSATCCCQHSQWQQLLLEALKFLGDIHSDAVAAAAAVVDHVAVAVAAGPLTWTVRGEHNDVVVVLVVVAVAVVVPFFLSS